MQLQNVTTVLMWVGRVATGILPVTTEIADHIHQEQEHYTKEYKDRGQGTDLYRVPNEYCTHPRYLFTVPHMYRNLLHCNSCKLCLKLVCLHSHIDIAMSINFLEHTNEWAHLCTHTIETMKTRK